MIENFPLLGAFVTGAVAGILVCIPVGPINAAIIHEGPEKGFRWSLFLGFGAVAMEAIYCAISFAGFTELLTAKLLKASFQLVSFCLLLYLGIKYTLAPELKTETRGGRKLDEKFHPHTAFWSGFIQVLGMLVDDGIVTAESAYAQLEDERQGVDSVVRGVRRVTVATIFGALTTMIAFTPAAMLTEGIGRLISVIVPVVVLSLIFSLIETKLILPAHLRHIRIDHTPPNRRTPLGFLKGVQQSCSGGLLRFADRVYHLSRGR